MSDLEARFKKAVWLIRNGPAEKSSNETKLLFYSYFKQVCEKREERRQRQTHDARNCAPSPASTPPHTARSRPCAPALQPGGWPGCSARDGVQ